MGEVGYVPERGYWIGPDLATGEDPWPLLWEQRDNDSCAHRWERVVVHRKGTKSEPVVRCSECRVPRCGHSDDPDPCMERRHHRTVHIYLGGEFAPIGGYLRDDEATR